MPSIRIGVASLPTADWFAAYVAEGLSRPGRASVQADREWFVGYGAVILDDPARAERIYDRLAGSTEERQVALVRLDEFRTAARIGRKPMHYLMEGS